MAKHHFGIMQVAPVAEEYFCAFEPEKYGCIAVEDDDLVAAEEMLSAVGADTYWHGMDKPRKGLAYCGITLIPPESLGRLAVVLEGYQELAELRDLLLRAEMERKFVIHFGI